jgi:hypothetical protein
MCVLREFEERLFVGIDYCMCVFWWTFMTDYVLGLIVACECVCSCQNHVTLLEPNVKLRVCNEIVIRCRN